MLRSFSKICFLSKSFSHFLKFNAINSSEIIYECSDKSTEQTCFKDFKVFKDFITTEEENSLFSELEPYLKRMRYEKKHWDNAIVNYRETEKSNWKQCNKIIIERMQEISFGPSEKRTDKILSQAHILDLADTGYIKPHVDSVKFCGGIIAGLSLLSDCIFRFALEKDTSKWINVFLPRCSLYVMSGDIRYLFTHEILSNESSILKGVPVNKTRRISVLCRNHPPKEPTTPPILESVQNQWIDDGNKS